LDQLDIQCDVGGVYDAPKMRFDHHQRSFDTFWTIENSKGKKKDGWNKTTSKKPEQPSKISKLSSAGLIYKHFGREIIKKVNDLFFKKNLSNKEHDLIYQKVY
jgi:uncharacterized UPF0160 family protein